MTRKLLLLPSYKKIRAKQIKTKKAKERNSFKSSACPTLIATTVELTTYFTTLSTSTTSPGSGWFPGSIIVIGVGGVVGAILSVIIGILVIAAILLGIVLVIWLIVGLIACCQKSQTQIHNFQPGVEENELHDIEENQPSDEPSNDEISPTCQAVADKPPAYNEVPIDTCLPNYNDCVHDNKA